ncbi:ATP-binding protein [Thiocapsa sp.]|uniref:sensor histidine kinase n=1 Tax=Thiocapsa sp. TaxID=2024551 RepID=UPI0025E3E651|nr:ATP-binding protein [Thiocapsa sp.]
MAEDTAQAVAVAVSMVGEAAARRLPPSWIGHLLVFGLLVVMAAGWFFIQARQTQQGFVADMEEHARLLSDAVALQARGAVLAQDAIDSILTVLLGSSARFVDYLDGIEPFTEDELSAFAAQAGLSMIRVIGPDRNIQGSPGVRDEVWPGCGILQRLIPVSDTQTLVLGVPRAGIDGCVLVGVDSRSLDRLKAAVGLPRALENLATLPGVLAVRMEGKPNAALPRAGGAGTPSVSIRRQADGRLVAEALTPVDGGELVLLMDADRLVAQRRRIWLEFAGFVLVLVVTGGLGTWLLYRHQQAHDRQLRAYERQLSQQREEAGLGRAAAGIAHEIRNPLNAMAMGLQRLQMEADGLDQGQKRLLSVVMEALRRTNDTVGGLLDYARAYRPRREPVRLDQLVSEQLSLYRQRIGDLDVRLTEHLARSTKVRGDPDLLRQVLDNLLRNALDAVPVGGRFEIDLSSRNEGARLTMTNDGLQLAPEALPRMLEPWFTTKTDGTGLGLAISLRIIQAHGGDLLVDSPSPGRLRVEVLLPD